MFPLSTSVNGSGPFAPRSRSAPRLERLLAKGWWTEAEKTEKGGEAAAGAGSEGDWSGDMLCSFLTHLHVRHLHSRMRTYLNHRNVLMAGTNNGLFQTNDVTVFFPKTFYILFWG